MACKRSTVRSRLAPPLFPTATTGRRFAWRPDTAANRQASSVQVPGPVADHMSAQAEKEFTGEVSERLKEHAWKVCIR